jgi:hypothetical protein
MSPDSLSTTFAALADPTRRAILARLAAGEASVTELAEPFDMSLPAISSSSGEAATRSGARAGSMRSDSKKRAHGWIGIGCFGNSVSTGSTLSFTKPRRGRRRK